MKDIYLTINEVYEATYKDKGSRFIAFAHHIDNSAQAKLLLDQYRKDAKYKSACHFCYAYKLGATDSNIRSSDDGEPSGTAGKPILNQIESFKLSDIFVVVIRFFGGTLLGTSGLIQAYKQVTINCLLNAKPVEVILKRNLSITFSYHLQSEIERMLKNFTIQFEEKIFEENVNFKITIKAGEFNALQQTLGKSAISNQIKLHEY